MFMRQSGIWPIFCQLMAILVKLLDMDFKFVLPSIYSIFDIQTIFEVNQKSLWLILQKSLKWLYLKTLYARYLCSRDALGLKAMRGARR